MMAKKLHQFKCQSFFELISKLIESQRFQIPLHPEYLLKEGSVMSFRTKHDERVYSLRNNKGNADDIQIC